VSKTKSILENLKKLKGKK